MIDKLIAEKDLVSGTELKRDNDIHKLSFDDLALTNSTPRCPTASIKSLPSS
jgi:hypothetical protein